MKPSPSEALDNLARSHRGVNLALWAIPPLVSLAVYWQGLFAELQQDDFAWLGLRQQIHGPGDWLPVLFEPMAQGTIRPISERLYFVVYSSLFGMWALPYRVTAFAVQTVNLVLLNAIGRRLTGSATAGVFAALIWTANASLAVPMSWTSAFNQILCACCVLGAFYFLLQYEHTNRERDWRFQWMIYLIGFGALELNVVYPALATGYALLCARQLWNKTLPLWIPAVGFALIHRFATGSSADSLYAPDFGLPMADVFIDLWSRALGPSQLHLISGVEPWFGPLGTVALTAALVGVAWNLWCKGKRQGAFLLAWFVIAIGPYLPLTNHRMDYYPFLASAGIAVLAAWGLQLAVSRGALTGGLAAVLMYIYLMSVLPIGRAQMFYYYVRGQRVKPLIERVIEAHERKPGVPIYIAGVDEPLFWGAIYDRPFRLWNVAEVYLLPDDSDGTARYLAERQDFERDPGSPDDMIVVKAPR